MQREATCSDGAPPRAIYRYYTDSGQVEIAEDATREELCRAICELVKMVMADPLDAEFIDA